MMDKAFWDFKALAPKKGALYIYGEIGSDYGFGDTVAPKQFKADLDKLGDIDTLDVYINSPGGNIFDAWAIVSILSRSKAKTIGHNDGLVASAAFDIYQSLDRRVASEASLFMTHNCWALAVGNKHTLRKVADEMDKIDSMMTATTAKKSGKSIGEIAAIQDAESWYTATEAVAEGFADELEEGVQVAACLDIEKYVEKYANAPDLERLKPKPKEEPVQPQAAEQGGILLPDNGAVNPQPTSDKNLDILADQRKQFSGIRLKLLGGN